MDNNINKFIFLLLLLSFQENVYCCDFAVNWTGSWIHADRGEYLSYNITQTGYDVTNATAKGTNKKLDSYSCPQPSVTHQDWSYFVQQDDKTNKRRCLKAKQVKDVILMYNRYENQDNVTSSDCNQGTTVADIVFVLDTSASICFHNGQVTSGTTCTNFELLKNFTANIVDKLALGDNAARIGLVSFSGVSKNEFFLNEYTDKASIKAAIHRTRYSKQATNTSSGIWAMHTQQFVPSRGDRPSVQNIAIFITDGKSTLSSDKVIPFATAAQNSGITMLAVGITKNISIPELKAISSPPSLLNQTYFLSPDFTTLDLILETIVSEACIASALTPTRCIYQKYIQPPKILHRYPVQSPKKCEFGSDGTYQITLNISRQQMCHQDNNSIATVYRNHVYFDTCHNVWPLNTATLWCLSTLNPVDLGDPTTTDNIQLLYRQDKYMGKFYCTRYKTAAGQTTLYIDSRDNAAMNCGISSKKNRRKRNNINTNDILVLTDTLQERGLSLQVKSISPNKGPQSGGTTVVVQGTFGTDKGSVILEDTNSVTFVNVIKWDNKSVSSSTGYSFSMNGSRQITITQSGGNILRSNISFEYLPDPVVTKVYPTTTIVAGGLPLTVEGQGFSYISEARLYIDMETRTESSNGQFTVESTSTFKSDPGKRLSDTMYVFITPEITLPVSFGTSRKKRDTGDDVINNEYLQFFAGVELDGVNEFRNFSESVPNQTPLLVLHNPEFTKFEDTRSYDNSTETFIDIKGKFLSNSLGKSSYRVTLGVAECNVTELLDNELLCTPPQSEPEVDMTGAYKEGLPRLKIVVGSLAFTIGHVDYVSNDYLIYIIIGVVIAALIVLAIVFGTIICHCKRRPQSNYMDTIKAKEIERQKSLNEKSNDGYLGLHEPSTSGGRNRILSDHNYEDTTLKRDRSVKYDQSYEYDNAFDENPQPINSDIQAKGDTTYDNNTARDNTTPKTDSIFWESKNEEPDAVKYERQSSNHVQIRHRLMSNDSYQDKSLSFARTFSYDNDQTYDNNLANGNQTM